MKILILGAKGMLAQAVIKQFGDQDLVLWDKNELDITKENQVHEKIGQLKPDLIINCAAYANVDEGESRRDFSLAINGQAVGSIAKIAQKLSIPVIHISTDYIFSGQNANGYDEKSNQFDPLNVYGQSKLLGEKLLMENADKYYLIRTSWLFGLGGKNFVETMLKLAQEKPEIKVVNDQIGRPTYTVDLAKQIRYIVDNKMPYGIYHGINETESVGISWYDFAKKIFELAKINVNLIPITSADIVRPAKRPATSVLLNTKLPKLRLWNEALADYLQVTHSNIQ